MIRVPDHEESPSERETDRHPANFPKRMLGVFDRDAERVGQDGGRLGKTGRRASRRSPLPCSDPTRISVPSGRHALSIIDLVPPRANSEDLGSAIDVMISPSRFTIRARHAWTDRRPRHTRYTARYFIDMVSNDGGRETTRYLLDTTEPSDGYVVLWENGRLDLSVEAEVLRPRWHDLFSDEQRAVAIRRLFEYGFDFDAYLERLHEAGS
jgi:hypothetical protein